MILDALNWRYATKQFDKTAKLSAEQIDTLCEALRLAPSSFGLQPWKFILIASQELKDQLVEHSWNQPQVSDASHVFVLCRPTQIDDSLVDNFLQDTAQTRDVSLESLEGYAGMMRGFLSHMDEQAIAAWMKDQVYLALGTLLTACAIEKIDACPMEGFLPDPYSEILGLADKGLTPVVVCPVGLRMPDDKYASLAKVRYSQEQVIEVL